MAILDARILPLLETLSASGVDWLAFELVEGINLGRQDEESEEALFLARERAMNPRESSGTSEEFPREGEANPILGDEQLKWASDYVERRLADAIDDLDVSFGLLETISKGGGDTRAEESGMPVHVVLLQDEQKFEVAKPDIAKAREGLHALKIALKKWLADNLDQGLSS